jgi:hypothetical protein
MIQNEFDHIHFLLPTIYKVIHKIKKKITKKKNLIPICFYPNQFSPTMWKFSSFYLKKKSLYSQQMFGNKKICW